MLLFIWLKHALLKRDYIKSDTFYSFNYFTVIFAENTMIRNFPREHLLLYLKLVEWKLNRNFLK